MRYLLELLKYGCASAAALLVDATLLFYLVRVCQFAPVAASSISFATGAVVAYLLSVKFVFINHRLRNRRVEFVAFCALGLIGLALNAAVIAFGTWLGTSLGLAKVCAAGTTFICNFMLRRQVLFVKSYTSPGIEHAFVE